MRNVDLNCIESKQLKSTFSILKSLNINNLEKPAVDLNLLLPRRPSFR